MRAMYRVNKYSSEVLDFLTKGLTSENSGRRIDNNPPNSGIMAVNVDWVGHIQEGDIFAVSHTYVQNGDVMVDPEMEFLRVQDGHSAMYYPMSCRQDGLGVLRQSVVISDSEMTVVDNREQADQASFANIWMKNIRWQQGLEVRVGKEEPKR